MGGGASKAPEKAAVSANSTATLQASVSISVPRGLSCTVQEAKRNSVIPFQSSVKGSSGVFAVGAQDTVVSPTSARLDDNQHFFLGDVCVPTIPIVLSPSPTTPAQSPTTAASFQLPAAVTPSIQRFATVPAVFPPPIGKTIPLGDLHLRKDLFLQPGEASLATSHTDKLFARRVPFALPTNYVFTSCGGQSGPIRCLSSSADGSQFAVAVAGQKHCFLVDGHSGKSIMSFRGHLDPILSCAHSRDSKFLVTASADCTVILWDLNNGKKLREIPVSYQANVCAVSDECDVVATTSTEDFVHMWEAKSCDPLVNFQRHSASIFSLAFSRRGQLIASGSTNGEIFVWHHVTGDVRFLFAKHRTPVLAVSFSHDGQRLVSVDRESVRMWDLFTGHCVFCRDTKGKIIAGSEDVEERDQISHDDTVRFTSCCFVAGNLVLCATTAKQILLLEPNTGTEILSIPTKGVVTSFATNWVADTVFVGDFLGNHHRLQLQFSARDVKAFNLNAKLVTKDKSSRLEKD